MSRSPLIQFRAMDDLTEALTARTRGNSGSDESLSFVARTMLMTHLDLLREELTTVDLTEDEALALCDALNGSFLGAPMNRYIHLDVGEAMSGGLAAKWDIDGDALVEKVENWTPGQRQAVIDAIQQWWKTSPQPEGLRTVGLVR